MTKSEGPSAAAAVPAADRRVFMAGTDADAVEQRTAEQVTGAPREPRTRAFLQQVLA